MEDDVLVSLEEYALLPQRINEPPIVILGCTAKELLILVSTTFILWLMILIPILIHTSYGISLFGALLLVLDGLTVYGLGKVFNKMKRGRPRGYYVHFLSVFFEQFGLADSHLFTHTGPMDLGRTKQFISIPSLGDVIDEYEDLREQIAALDGERAAVPENT